ncbi:MAG: hypothetical protein ACWGHH_06410 [Sulfurovaceae bacterium]
MAMVATGQITVTDQNDARPITGNVVASLSTTQVYSKDESSVAYTPDWASTPNTLSAYIYVGGASVALDITAQLTNRKWSNSIGGASLGANTTLVVNTNLTEATPSKTYYFEGDYTDPATGLVSHIIGSLTLQMVKTGTNAVWINSRGQSVILQSDTATKNVAVMCADLIRAAGVDTTGVTYKFFENGSTLIDAALSGVSGKYGLKTTAVGVTPTGSNTNIGVNIPTAGAWSTYNTLVIDESAIQNLKVFSVQAKDSDNNIYQDFFTIFDKTDPYSCNVFSTTGDKLQNGIGSTDLYPIIYNGAAQVEDTTGWTFKWTPYDKNGNRCGFIDTTRTAVADGRAISANTANNAGIATITYGGTNINMAAGDMIKSVKSDGTAYYFEVQSNASNVVTVRTATVSTFLNTPFPVTGITANMFAGGKLFVCTGTGATAGTLTTNGGATAGMVSKIAYTGYDVDIKGNVVCEATRP